MQQRMTIDHMQNGDISYAMTNNSNIDISSPLAKFVTGKNYIRLFQEISSCLKIFKNRHH
jgi:hypothetical protein